MFPSIFLKDKGSSFKIIYVCVCVCVRVCAQSLSCIWHFATLCKAMNSLPGFSVHGIFPGKKCWSGLPFPPVSHVQFSSVQSLSCVWLFATPRIAAHQASLSITNSRSILKLTPIESVMPSNHLILCHPLLLLPSVFPSVRVFSNELGLRPQQQSFQWMFRDDCL